MRTYGKDEVKRGQYTGVDDVDGLIIISGEAERVGRYAFAHSNVRKVVIDVPVVEQGAFYNCQQLEEVVFSDNVLKIEAEAFYQCANLTRINFSKNLIEIGRTAFSGCTNLEELVFYDKLKVIEEMAFSKCESLYAVKFSRELHKIGAYAFLNCNNLTEVDFSGGNLIIDGEEQNPDDMKLEDIKSFVNVAEHPFLGCDKAKFYNAQAYAYSSNGTYKKVSIKLMAIWLKSEELEAKVAERILKKKKK